MNTLYYINNKDIGNVDYNFYDPNTFGMDIYKEPCTLIKSNSDFRNKVNKNIKCRGTWCINETYNCILHKTTECYSVEHIIDTNGEEFINSKCKQIAGNLVMSYGRWNSQLDMLSKYDYDFNIDEKTAVYSKERIGEIRNIIVKCNPDCIETSSTPNNNTYNIKDHDIITFTIVLLIFLSLCVIFYIIKNIINICSEILCRARYERQNVFSINVV